ncbi:unnamed protein product [Discula destructiva]
MARAIFVAALVATSVVTAKPSTRNGEHHHDGTRDAVVPTVHFPLNYMYGGQYKIATAVYVPWSNTTIDVVYDQGSENFWLMAPNSTLNWGCNSLACQGKCNATETLVYDYTESSTATTQPFGSQYMYGLFDKVLNGDIAMNDTLTFVNVAGAESTIPGVEVALEYYLQMRIGLANDTCGRVPNHDTGILGVAPFQQNAHRNTTGPHVRKNLLDQGQIGADVHCIWMDKAPADAEGTYTGGGLMGGIDTSKYTGPLVKIPNITPELEAQQATVGYYVSIPQVSVGGVTFNMSTDATSCFLDSGTHLDDIPVPYDEQDAFLEATGIVIDPVGYYAWPSPCDQVPANKTIDLTWTGVNANETVTVKVPIRNYVRGNISPAGYCSLNLSPGGCLLGAPFQTATFFAADDERDEIALAQGGVSSMGSVPDAAAIVERIP